MLYCYRKCRGDFGSILSKSDAAYLDSSEWRELILTYQKEALSSDSGIPFIYGQDDVHGVNYCRGTGIFPHNIGLGAANDEELMYQIGAAIADEAKLAGMLWNFAPCVAVSTDPRWGRTYESYSRHLYRCIDTISHTCFPNDGRSRTIRSFLPSFLNDILPHSGHSSASVSLDNIYWMCPSFVSMRSTIDNSFGSIS